jgi:hypothetical protein
MPPQTPEFDHYAPSEFLLQNRDSAIKGMADLDGALTRFEKLFSLLNEMLPKRK